MADNFIFDLEEYDTLVGRFRVSSAKGGFRHAELCNATLGAIGEAIECYGSVLSWAGGRDESIEGELGDVMFYLTWITSVAPLSFGVPVHRTRANTVRGIDRYLYMQSLSVLLIQEIGGIVESVKKTVFPTSFKTPVPDIENHMSDAISIIFDICSLLNVSMMDILMMNYNKLSQRYDP
jgi:hypothetical protein